MKKIKYIFLCLGVVIMIAACKNFLVTTPKDGSVSSANYWQTTAQFDSFMFGIYQDLVSGVSNMLILSELISQDGQTSGQIQVPLTQYMSASRAEFSTHWNMCYDMIGKSNTLLSYLPTASIPDADKTRLEGEALFLRGYAYFTVAAYFGNAPLVLKPYEPSQVSLNSTSRDSLFNQAIADLTKSAIEIPTIAQWGSDNLGRATKGTAYAILAWANMYIKNWAAAEAASNSLIALGTYNLLPTVRSVFSEWNPNSIESIWETQNQNIADGKLTWSFHEGGTVLEAWTSPRSIGYQWAVGGGWGELVATPKFAASFESGDERRVEMVKKPGGKYKGEQMTDTCLLPMNVENLSTFSTKYWLGPGTLSGESYYGQEDIPLMRYAEFLLNYSEILFMEGKTGPAYDNLNKIRARAKLAPLPAQTDQTVFINALQRERRAELNFEPNWWSHFTRTGTAAAYVQSMYGETWNATWNLYPIPQSERDQNPHLSQNPGY